MTLLTGSAVAFIQMGSFSLIILTTLDGSQIWHLSVVTKTSPGDIFIQVSADPASGQWLLERVLFTQEAEKYAQ